MTTTEGNKRIVRRIPEEVATKGNLDLLDEIFAEDAIDHTPFGEMEGREAIKDGFEQIRGAFPDFSVTVEDVIAEGDTVATRVVQRGTHEGGFMGVDPTGRKFEIETMAFVRLKDGKVVERWVQSDLFGLMQQLGVVEPPGE